MGFGKISDSRTGLILIAVQIVLIVIAVGSAIVYNSVKHVIAPNTFIVSSTDSPQVNKFGVAELMNKIVLMEDVTFTFEAVSRINVIYNDSIIKAVMTDTNRSYPDMMGLALSHGNWAGEDNANDSVIINEALAFHLFGHTKVLREEIDIEGSSFFISAIAHGDNEADKEYKIWRYRNNTGDNEAVRAEQLFFNVSGSKLNAYNRISELINEVNPHITEYTITDIDMVRRTIDYRCRIQTRVAIASFIVLVSYMGLSVLSIRYHSLRLTVGVFMCNLSGFIITGYGMVVSISRDYYLAGNGYLSYLFFGFGSTDVLFNNSYLKRLYEVDNLTIRLTGLAIVMIVVSYSIFWRLIIRKGHWLGLR